MAGLDLECIDEGTGAPVVFIHGGSSDVHYWEPQRVAISARHRFVACSQRGQGRSPDATPRDGPDVAVDDLLALIDRLEAGPVHVVGFSSAVGIRAALSVSRDTTARSRLRSLVLIEPNVPWLLEDQSADRSILDAWRSDNEQLRVTTGDDRELRARRWFELVDHEGPGSFERQDPALRAMWLENFERPGARRSTGPIRCPDLAAIRTPTLVLAGELGMPYSRRITERLAECIPSAELRVVPDVTHFMTYQAPEVLNPILLEFLERH